MNNNRRAIRFLVLGAIPPKSNDVLWVDISDGNNPTLKVYLNGKWINVK